MAVPPGQFIALQAQRENFGIKRSERRLCFHRHVPLQLQGWGRGGEVDNAKDQPPPPGQGQRSQHLPLGQGQRSQHIPPPPGQGQRSQHPWPGSKVMTPPSPWPGSKVTTPPPSQGHRSLHHPPARIKVDNTSPLPRYSAQAGGGHPTGMHSCYSRQIM